MAVAVVGLGIMGSAYAAHLLAAGETVLGADPDPAARLRLTAQGGEAHGALGDWLEACPLVILSLSTPEALRSVCAELAGHLRPGQVVMDTGTFALADKFAARDGLAEAGVAMLDCTVSGTGTQAAEGDILMMASGPEAALAIARPYIRHFTRKVIEAGEFGAASRLKYVANHAVTLHNVAAAETLNYGVAMGLDPDLVYELLSTGAGQSRMSDLRMPLMISGAYEPPSATLTMFAKDLEIIGADLARLGVAAPLFEASAKLYAQAEAILPETHDTASVYEVYRTSGTSGPKGS